MSTDLTSTAHKTKWCLYFWNLVFIFLINQYHKQIRK